MSESTSSSHPVSPSSSLSSTDSAPRSEPTSDEQPDLGFNELLREYSHLQPFPRIPIQIRSATSSTTPTYHPESVAGSDFRLPSARPNTRTTQSSLSTFTRPPTSSIQPDGSTVWTHPFIAPYLPSSTPSNDTLPEEDDDEFDDDYSPISRASTALTVEIGDFRSSDDETRDLDPDRFSPEPTSAIPILVAGENQRRLETPQTEDDIDSLSSHNRRADSSITSTDIIRRTVTSSSQEQSDNSNTSMRLQSQLIPSASASSSTSSLSFASSDDASVPISIAGPSAPSSINSRIDSTVGVLTSSESTSTLMNVFLNRSRNPIPPRTASDSFYPSTTRTTSSSFSLISYQLPETPSVADVHREESEPEAMLTSLGSSSSRSTALAQRPFNSHSILSVPITDSSLQNPHSLLAVTPLTNPHSFASASPLTNPHSLPGESPLINPYSSAVTPETDPRFLIVNDRVMSTALENEPKLSHSGPLDIVDDLDTPDKPPSEAILYEPPRRIFEPIRDDEDEPETSNSRQSTVDSYRPGGHTPLYLSGHTPKATRSQETGDAQPPFEDHLLDQPETSDVSYPSGEISRAPHENGPAGPGISTAEAITTSHQRTSEPSPRQETFVELSPSSMGIEEYPSYTLCSSNQRTLRMQAYPSSVGLHLLPSEPLVVPSRDSGPNHVLRENDSPLTQTQIPAPVSHVADLEAQQLYAEATTSQTRLLPSLGYLDEALSFIAAERVRLTAARTCVSGLTTGVASNPETQLGRESEGEDGGLRRPEGEDWRDAVGGEQGGESKRRRRRKRPLKQPNQQGPSESSPIRHRNAPNGFQTTGSTSSTKKRRSKSAAPPLSSSASVLSLGSSKSGTMTPGRRKDKHKGKEFLIPAPPPSSSDPRSIVADSDLDDGGRTPTNVPVPGIIRVSSLLEINPTGAKGKRIGRRERERLKFDISKARNHKSSGDPDSFDDPIDIGVDYDPNTDNNDDGEEVIEESGDGPGENDSISNMSLLQPPRRLRHQSKSKAGETSLSLIPKNVPSITIGRISVQSSINFHAHEINNGGSIDNTGNEDLFRLKPKDVAGGDKEQEKKRRVRPKAAKSIGHSRSYPTLDFDTEIADSSQLESKESATGDKINITDGSVGRNNVLESTGPQNHGELTSPNSKQSRLLALAQSLQQSFPDQSEELGLVIKQIEKHQKAVVSPIPVPAKGKKANKGHTRTASEGAITTGSEFVEVPHPITDVEEEKVEEDIDPRGRPPKKKDPLLHVFIDHSNILIGLLSHLRRATPYRKRLYIGRRKPLPALVTTFTPQGKIDPAAAVKPSSSRPLAMPAIVDPSSSSARDYLIPLPSFATLPRSLPTTSLLSSTRKADEAHSSEEFARKNGAHSDGCEGSGGSLDSGGTGGSAITWRKEKKHLWHAALILILERGRPITRRVVVASSPLYQPMETIERFGYNLRVFIRVPDLGDGMDRVHNTDKGKATSVGKSSHTKRMLSGSESGSGGNASSGAANAGSSSLHPYYAKSNPGTPPGKMKYREQGVDELLQLKLHQAIAASDNVPDGSTIILATGDGNMGQFDEEGFLGPIRTALQRGWKVELYAWEGGLSRAWTREFGEDTVWGKKGRFRIIGMGQFASWLVEVPGCA